MSNIQIVKIPFDGEYIVQGDTIAKTSAEVIETGLDLTTATIKMQIYNGNTKIIDVSNGSGITVIDDTNFEIDEVTASNNNLPVGSFEGDLEITDVNNVRFTYYRVVYTILRQYTKP